MKISTIFALCAAVAMPTLVNAEDAVTGTLPSFLSQSDVQGDTVAEADAGEIRGKTDFGQGFGAQGQSASVSVANAFNDVNTANLSQGFSAQANASNLLSNNTRVGAASANTRAVGSTTFNAGGPDSAFFGTGTTVQGLTGSVSQVTSDGTSTTTTFGGQSGFASVNGGQVNFQVDGLFQSNTGSFTSGFDLSSSTSFDTAFSSGFNRNQINQQAVNFNNVGINNNASVSAGFGANAAASLRLNLPQGGFGASAF